MSDYDSRFSGDMSRNEVELDLNKFMELLQEKSALKDRIRELEDVSNTNPWQKVIFMLLEWEALACQQLQWVC